MPQQVRVAPGTYAVHLRLDDSTSMDDVHAVNYRDAKHHAGTLPNDVFAFYYFDVEEDGILRDDIDRVNRSKQYFVDAELFEYDAAVNLPGITEFTLERMRTLSTSAMRYASGRKIRFFNPAWQEIVRRH